MVQNLGRILIRSFLLLRLVRFDGAASGSGRRCGFLFLDADGNGTAGPVDGVEYGGGDAEDAPGRGGPPETFGGDDAPVLAELDGGSWDESIGPQQQAVPRRCGIAWTEVVRCDPAQGGLDLELDPVGGGVMARAGLCPDVSDDQSGDLISQ